MFMHISGIQQRGSLESFPEEPEGFFFNSNFMCSLEISFHETVRNMLTTLFDKFHLLFSFMQLQHFW